MMYWIFRNADRRVYVVDNDASELTLYAIDDRNERIDGANGSLTYSPDDQGRRSLHTILVNPAGTGLGAMIMWCFAVSAGAAGHPQISLTLPAPDVRAWYENIGFATDPVALQDARDNLPADDRPEAEREAEIAAFAAGFPMVGDSQAVAGATVGSWQAAWEMESQGFHP